MPNLKNALSRIRTLEELSENDTVIHRIHPTAKMITTLAYLIAVISFNKYDISGLAAFAAYPVILAALSETPYKPLFARLLIALPFSFFAGLSNIFLDRDVAFGIGGIAVSYGMISFTSIIAKTMLTVMAVLILVATTPIAKVAHELVRLKVPRIFVIQMMLTFRYIGVLAEETGSMITAYHMRSPRQRGIEMAHMGTFAGQLLLRSFDRAERIYFAMKCRGFDGAYNFAASRPMLAADWLYMLALTAAFALMRSINISLVLGGLIGR